MCFMDWRIGRLVRSIEYVIPAAGTPQIILPPNPQRVGLSLFSGYELTGGIPRPAPMTFQVRSAAGITSGGVGVAIGSPVHLTLATHGDLCTKGFVIYFGYASQLDGLVVEYIVPESVLTLGLQLIQKEYPGLR